MRMVFSHKIALDKDSFITDHVNIDKLIQSLKLSGSCEQMHKTICEAYKAFFLKKNLKLLACKCTIQPIIGFNEKQLAYIDYVYVNPLASITAQLLLTI